MKASDENGKGSATLVREQLKTITEPSDLDKNRQRATQVRLSCIIISQPFNCMLCSRTSNSVLRLMRTILMKVKDLKTTDIRIKDKSAVNAYMSMLAKEAVINRYLEVLRHVADNESEKC